MTPNPDDADVSGEPYTAEPARSDAVPPPVATADDRQDEVAPHDMSVPTETLHALVGPGIEHNEFRGSAAIGHFAVAAHHLHITEVSQGVRSRLSISKVSRTWLDRSRTTYVGTDSDSRLDKMLDRHPVVCLDGSSATGREASGYLALTRRHAPERIAVVTLAEGVNLAETVPELRAALKSEHGHLFRLPERFTFESTDVTHLEKAAEDRNATVLLVCELTPTQRATLEPLTVRHQAPRAHDVFRSHLRHLLDGDCLEDCGECDGTCVSRYVEACMTDTDLHAELSALTRPADCVDIAYRIAEVRPAPGEIGSCLEHISASRLRNRALAAMAADEETGYPYQEQRVQHQRAFRICYAAFHGAALRDVLDVTERFMDLLDRTRGWDMLGRPTWHLSISELLGDNLIRSENPDRVVPGSGDIALLRDPLMGRAILDVAWNEYAGFRIPLIRLLDGLVRDDRCRIWQHAAGVAGKLAAYDFSQLCDELIDEWSRSDRHQVRQAAALAMELAAHHEGLQHQVRRHVRNWAAASKLCRDTAARTYRTRYGQMFPQDALPDLKRIAEDPMQASGGVVSTALENLIPRFSLDELFGEVASWTDPPTSAVAAHGVRLFVRMASLVDGDNWMGQPTFLRLLCDERVDRDATVRMWQCALAWPATARPAWRVLERWVGLLGAGLDTEPDRSAVRALLRDIVSRPALHRRAVFHMKHVWRQNPPEAGFDWFAQHLEESSCSRV